MNGHTNDAQNIFRKIFKIQLKPMIDPKENLNALAGKGAETPLLLLSSCYNTGWCYECSQWQGRHCPAAISGIGQPLATSQSLAGYPVSISLCPGYPYHHP